MANQGQKPIFEVKLESLIGEMIAEGINWIIEQRRQHAISEAMKTTDLELSLSDAVKDGGCDGKTYAAIVLHPFAFASLPRPERVIILSDTNPKRERLGDFKVVGVVLFRSAKEVWRLKCTLRDAVTREPGPYINRKWTVEPLNQVPAEDIALSAALDQSEIEILD